MSSKHLMAQLFPAPDNPVMMMRRSRSPASASGWLGLTGGLDKLHRSVGATLEHVHGSRARVPEDEQAIPLEAQLVNSLVERHGLRVGSPHHDRYWLVDRLRDAAHHWRRLPADPRGTWLLGGDALLLLPDLRDQPC